MMNESIDMSKLIEKKLREAFEPKHLIVKNESYVHTGHIGSPQSGQSHFHVTITASRLEGLTRIEQQRQVYAVLQEELTQGLHALSMDINIH